MDVRGLGDIEIPEDETSHISAGLAEYIDILWIIVNYLILNVSYLYAVELKKGD